MSHDVIMPALGMAQDTGRIVSWLKAPGDPVADGEALFEVETDKAVMEVPSPAEGYLSAVTGSVNDDVTVGAVIAQIVDSADAAAAAMVELAIKPVTNPNGDEVSPATKPAAHEPVPTGASSPERSLPKQIPNASGRVLASPKARRLAKYRGIDLVALRAGGVREPIHADDLDQAMTAQMSVLTAHADAVALDALFARAEPGEDHARLYATFAAGAWRATFDVAEPGVVIQRPDGTSEQFGSEDRNEMRLIDLTGKRLTSYMPTSGPPTLSIARDGVALVLNFAFQQAALPLEAAAAWLEELAARLENPIRQLV